ncbi:MAG: MMPL family transporter [Woeseiaceae bacterium]|nr:MMPL family transporter [Woeseiaceae bacterium]
MRRSGALREAFPDVTVANRGHPSRPQVVSMCRMYNVFANLYAATVLRRPRRTLAVVAAAVGLLATQLPQFALDASSESLLLESDSGIQFYRAVRARYGADDFLILTYTPSRPMFSDAVLGELSALREDVVSLPHVASVVSILDVPLLESPPLSPKELADGAPTLLDERANRSLAQKELRTSPLYSNRLLSEDGGTTAMQINLTQNTIFANILRERGDLREKRLEGELSAEEEQQLARLSREIHDARDHYRQKVGETIDSVRSLMTQYRDGARLHLGGLPMISHDMLSFIKHDLVVFGGGLLAALVTLLALIFRQPRWVVLPLLSCGATVTAMMGMLALMEWPVTVVSSNFVSLMLILTLSLNVHLVVRFRELHSDKPDAGALELVDATVSNKFYPALYTVLTTMVAFASLLVSDIRPVIDFGWMMVAGMALAFILTFMILPASLVLLEPGAPPRLSRLTNRITGLFTQLVERVPRGTLAVYALLTAAALFGISQLSVDNRFIDYFKSDTAIHQGMTVIDQQLGGTTPLDIVLDADPEFLEQAAEEEELDLPGEPGLAATSYWYNTARLDTLDRAQEYLESLDDVGKVLSLATTADVLRQIVGTDELDNLELSIVHKRMPDDVRAALFEPYLSADGNQTRIAARVYETSDTLRRDELLESIRTWFSDELGIAADRVHLTGLMVLYNNVLQSLLRSQVTTVGAVLVVVFLMFAASFRSAKTAAVALVPNIVSASLVLGLMSTLGVPLDIMTITIAAIVIGIGVDHTIHYVYRFREEFERTPDYRQAIDRCHGSIGHAIYYTSITIILGFSILALSSFVPTIYFGLLTGLAMAIALIANLTLLPLLLSGLEVLGPGDDAKGARQ